jgi:hypothetical protein
MQMEAEVLSCDTSEHEIVQLELASLLSHDYDGPLTANYKRLEEIGCFSDLPTKERLALVEANLFEREAKWIAKMMLDIPGASKVYSEDGELEKTVKQLLPKLLIDKLLVN